MTPQPDPNLKTIIDALVPENNLGVLLAAQMGGTPREVQIILQTTEYDAGQDALKVTGQHIIRAIGVIEHRVSLGLFHTIVLSSENPLLYRHNSRKVQVYFRGVPDHIDSFMIDLNQLYGQTYGVFDPSGRMADEINRTMPLYNLLKNGNGLLCTSPQPFAEKLQKLLAQHNMTCSFLEVEDHPHDDGDHHHHDLTYQLLAMDDSYLVAQLFSSDPMKLPGSG
ncbi:MAG: hypothetical protein F9K27_00075 [Anaerolineae bacterium]|jgi:hypothetical protein|nr:MAG: hypothetical protein F9K27_00075 [Anaerolineae bacterium]